MFGRPTVSMAPFALLCLLSILHGYASGFMFELTSSRKELNSLYEESLEIECSFNPDHSDYDSEVKYVEEIHIVRRGDSKRWNELAKLQANGYSRLQTSKYKAHGLIEPNVNNTFLKLNWKIASEAELGMYRCDVVVKDGNFRFDVLESNILTVFKHNVTTEELLDVSQRQLDDLQLEFDKFRKQTVKKMATLKQSVKELRNESRARDDEPEDKISDTYLDQLKRDIERSVLANVSVQLEDMTCSRLSRCPMPTDAIALGTTTRKFATTKPPKVTRGTTSFKFPTTKTPKLTRGTTSFKLPTTKPPKVTRGTTSFKFATTKPPKATRGTTLLTSATTRSPKSIITQPTKPALPWPEGTFSLLNSRSGCPETPVSPFWLEGYMKYHTESVDENHDNVTYPSNLAEPSMEVDRFGNHFLVMHFCTNLNPASGSDPWPTGSYCMNRVSYRCPPGFRSGYMDIDEEDNNYSGQSRGTLPEMLFFCCRDDGSPNIPITLPSSKPFYLYRFGGQCQEVKDMQVTPETMLFDTENENNQDDYQNDNHPDGKLADVEIELCYYS